MWPSICILEIKIQQISSHIIYFLSFFTCLRLFGDNVYRNPIKLKQSAIFKTSFFQK